MTLAGGGMLSGPSPPPPPVPASSSPSPSTFRIGNQHRCYFGLGASPRQGQEGDTVGPGGDHGVAAATPTPPPPPGGCTPRPLRASPQIAALGWDLSLLCPSLSITDHSPQSHQ